MVRIAVNECKNWRKTAWFRRRVPLDESLRLAAEDPEPEDGSLLAHRRRNQAVFRQFLHSFTAIRTTQARSWPSSGNARGFSSILMRTVWQMSLASSISPDERAEYLVERYADLLLRIGKTWLGDMDDAKDICQTVLIKMLDRR